MLQQGVQVRSQFQQDPLLVGALQALLGDLLGDPLQGGLLQEDPLLVEGAAVVVGADPLREEVVVEGHLPGAVGVVGAGPRQGVGVVAGGLPQEEVEGAGLYHCNQVLLEAPLLEEWGQQAASLFVVGVYARQIL